MKAIDVMTPDPVTIRPDSSIMEAVRIMLQRRFSGLPVVNEAGAIVGIVTEGDLLRRAETGTQRRRPRWIQFFLGPGFMATEYAQACARKVEEIMTPSVLTVSEDTPLDEIVNMMERHHIKRLPVVRDGKLVGIVSRANLLRALALVAHETKPVSADDTTIRDRLMAEFKREFWAPASMIDVVVRNGVVHLWGSLLDERQRRAIRVAAENTPGVRAVEDHLVWVEPNSGMVFTAQDETNHRN